ncbi:hypothetical protein GEMRC1_007046 [Eukaryota sp. GEM-RC1]
MTIGIVDVSGEVMTLCRSGGNTTLEQIDFQSYCRSLDKSSNPNKLSPAEGPPIQLKGKKFNLVHCKFADINSILKRLLHGILQTRKLPHEKIAVLFKSRQDVLTYRSLFSEETKNGTINALQFASSKTKPVTQSAYNFTMNQFNTKPNSVLFANWGILEKFSEFRCQISIIIDLPDTPSTFFFIQQRTENALFVIMGNKQPQSKKWNTFHEFLRQNLTDVEYKMRE